MVVVVAAGSCGGGGCGCGSNAVGLLIEMERGSHSVVVAVFG